MSRFRSSEESATNTHRLVEERFPPLREYLVAEEYDLRDRFAIQAMDTVFVQSYSTTAEMLAGKCYEVADAMIKARRKKFT
jgi:hypothetical protein